MIAALFLLTRGGGSVSVGPLTLRDWIIAVAVMLTVTIAFEWLSRLAIPKKTKT